jgi:23S rRNA pseudouridine1911/1915/1917 synthase
MLNFDVDTITRLDKFLASKVDVSRSLIQKAIKAGKVLVDGRVVLKPDYEVNTGNKVSLPEFESDELKPSNIELKIVFENQDLAVIDKPAGLVVHPGAGNKEDTLSQALLTYFPNIKNVGEPHRPGIVHRLDEDTSGLIIIAKTNEAYNFLKQSFLEHQIEKEYLALVKGVPKLHEIINVPLEKVPLKQKMKTGSGKEAITEYFLVASDESLQNSLIRVKLHTGRTHQIRAHMSYIGHPIVGDTTYGSKDAELDRQFLHAYRLKFKLMDGTWLELESPLPQDLQNILNQLNINYKKFGSQTDSPNN